MPDQYTLYTPIGVTHCWRCNGRPAVIWIETRPDACRAICDDCRNEYCVTD